MYPPYWRGPVAAPTTSGSTTAAAPRRPRASASSPRRNVPSPASIFDATALTVAAALWLFPGGLAGEGQHAEGAHSLRSMDQYALDVRRRGRAGMERRIVRVAEFGAPIGVMHIDDDVGGIEEHDQVLREIGD